MVGMFGEQAHGVGELALGGVDAAEDEVEHEVDDLLGGEPSPSSSAASSAEITSSPGASRRAASSR